MGDVLVVDFHNGNRRNIATGKYQGDIKAIEELLDTGSDGVIGFIRKMNKKKLTKSEIKIILGYLMMVTDGTRKKSCLVDKLNLYGERAFHQSGLEIGSVSGNVDNIYLFLNCLYDAL